jgi:hypothetical protein
MTSFGEAYGVLFKTNCAWCGNIVAIKLNFDHYLQQKLKKIISKLENLDSINESSHSSGLTKNCYYKKLSRPFILKNLYTLIINLFGRKNCGVFKIVNSKVFINKV